MKYFKSLISKFKSIFLYCGLTSDQFQSIQKILIRKNERVFYVASAAIIILGTILLYANAVAASLAIFPCIFMIVSGIILLATKFIPNKTDGLIKILCYLMLIALYAASAVTSFLPSNKAIPATTFVAFLALIPLLINDSPARMSPVIAASGTIFVVLSYFFKESSAFQLDLLNTLTFVLIGIFVYAVMARRNAMEVWQTIHVNAIQTDLINALGSVIEARDGVTAEHVLHAQQTVTVLTDALKRNKKYSSFSESFFDNVCKASALHDIGKMRTPDMILSKSGKLTDEEYEIMKRHTIDGADIIEKATKNSEDQQFAIVARNIVKYHHEKWDGSGYPCGLKGEDIPLEARIVAIADVYDALISERPYKEPFPKEKALELILEGRGTHFDPDLVDIFIKIERRKK